MSIASTRRSLLIGSLALALSPRVMAQATAKPLRIIVPFPAGGSSDAMARIVADKLRGNYAATVLVENRVGASGRAGVEAVKNAETDGSTLLFAPDFLMTVYPHSFRKLSYDPLADFAPVALLARSGLALAAGPALPAEVRTATDYVAWAKAHPKQGLYATMAAGGTPHLAGVMLARDAQVKLSPVHDKDGAPALEDLLGGRIPVGIYPIGELLPHVRGGKLRLLATTGDKRSRVLPEVPTLAESGFKDIVVMPWLGFFAPARTPRETIARLSNAIADAAGHGEAQQSFLKLGMEAVAMTPVGFAATLKSDLEKWAPIVKASGFSAED